MRWIRFTAPGMETPSYGILEGEMIRETEGSPFDSHRANGNTHALSDVKIEIPFEPKTFYAVGFNYTDHIMKVSARTGQAPNIPTQPDVGYRTNQALIATGETVVIPADATDAIQYEGELVVVIGKKAKHLSEEDALSCVLGRG